MIITVAGIRRSASTLLFNLVRLLAEETTQSSPSTSYCEIPRQIKRYHICKIHDFDPEVFTQSDVILTSWRPLSEVIPSFTRFRNRQPTDKEIALWKASYAGWSTAGITFYYNQITTLKPPLVEKIAEHCQLEPTPAQIQLILDKARNLTPPTDKDFDPETFLYRNHFTNPELS